MKRREFLRLLAGGVALSSSSGFAAATHEARTIAVTASKFTFTPDEIKVAKGVALTLALTTTDFAHGFSIPDLGVRRDLTPGRTVEVTLTPVKEGRYPFLCDNFCGDGHDHMSGVLVVV